MTYEIIAPKTFRADIKPPASKSISNRSLVMAALTEGGLTPDNLSDCDDTEVMVRALRDMPYEIDVRAAGTAMRFLTAFLSARTGEHVITGTERMKHRPIRVLVESLRTLGAEITYLGEEGYPPLLIRGHELDGGRLQMAGNVSSQYISAMLMIAPVLRSSLSIQLTGTIMSRPYIDLTLNMMRERGASAEWRGSDKIEVMPQPYKPLPYVVESDWSAASYWYEMVALSQDPSAEVSLAGLAGNSCQGDAIVRHIFSLLGVRTEYGDTDMKSPATVTLRRSATAGKSLTFDFTGCPDLAQTLVCTCCGLGLPFDFTGLSTLRVKETDRIKALRVELRKLGFDIHDRHGSELHWNGKRIRPTLEPVDTYEDHRMAMAFAPLALRLGGIRINNPDVVTKSYPAFWDDLKKAGFALKQTSD